MGTVKGLVRWQAAGLLTDKEETDLRVYITRLLISDRDNQKRSLSRFPYQQENPDDISIPAGISYFSLHFSSLDEAIVLLSLYYYIDPSESWIWMVRIDEISLFSIKPLN